MTRWMPLMPRYENSQQCTELQHPEALRATEGGNMWGVSESQYKMKRSIYEYIRKMSCRQMVIRNKRRNSCGSLSLHVMYHRQTEEVGDIKKCYRWLIFFIYVNKLSTKVRGVAPMKNVPNLLSQTNYSAIDSFGVY